MRSKHSHGRISCLLRQSPVTVEKIGNSWTFRWSYIELNTVLSRFWHCFFVRWISVRCECLSDELSFFTPVETTMGNNSWSELFFSEGRRTSESWWPLMFSWTSRRQLDLELVEELWNKKTAARSLPLARKRYHFSFWDFEIISNRLSCRMNLEVEVEWNGNLSKCLFARWRVKPRLFSFTDLSLLQFQFVLFTYYTLKSTCVHVCIPSLNNLRLRVHCL